MLNYSKGSTGAVYIFNTEYVIMLQDL